MISLATLICTTEIGEAGGNKHMPYLMEKNCKPLSVPQDDRISKLPDEILVDILSTLKFKESAQTSVLSHRWSNLWKHVPLLHFDATKDQCRSHNKTQWRKYMPVFVNWVNHVLHLHNCSTLREFRIFFYLDKSYQNEIDNWLEYAFRRGVERLELNLSECGYFQHWDKENYYFPNHLLDQTTELGVQLAANSSFSCLKALYFVNVNVTGDAIESLMLRCPLLEDLRVIASMTLINLVVSGPSLLLKHLEIMGCYYAELITISNTNIVSLKVEPQREGMLLIDLPMLTEVWVNGRLTRKRKLFSLLSCCLSQLTVFTLEIDVPEMYVDLFEFPQLQNLKRLVLVTVHTHFQSLIRLTSLIDLCPRLVEFTLMFYPVMGTGHIRENETARGQSLNGLQVLELCGYHGGENQNELIMFLIEKAIALEKIVIDPREVNTGHGAEPIEDERAEKARRQAIEKFEGVVPQHIELVIL